MPTWLKVAIVLVVLAASVWVLQRELREYTFAEIIRVLGTIPIWRVAASVAVTILGYAALIGHDVIGLQHLRKKVALHKTALAAFVVYAFSNSAPVSFAVAGALRFRFYNKWGLNSKDTSRLVGLTLSTYVLGLLTASAFALTIGHFTMPRFLHLPIHNTIPLGIAAAVLLIAYITWTLARGKALGAAHHEALGPTVGFTATQIGVSLADWFLSAFALYVLLQGPQPVSFRVFFGVFLLAQLVCLIAHTPGGIGVFDALMIWGLKAELPAPATVAALFGYRVIYYLIPLLIAATILFAREGRKLFSKKTWEESESPSV